MSNASGIAGRLRPSRLPLWLSHPFVRTSAPAVLSIAIGLLLGGVFAMALGVSPWQFYETLFSGTLGSGFGIGQVLFKATPLIFTGLSVALAFQARLFNIGAEGQMVIGALVMASLGVGLDVTPAVALPVVLLVGALGGAAWGAIPGVLKAKTGSHEVIVTILLNFIAVALVNYLLVSGLSLPETVRTAELPEAVRLFRLSVWFPDLKGSPANAALLLGLVAAIALHLWMRHSPLGFSFRILGEGAGQARYAGLRVDRLVILAMTMSGAIAGLAGASFVLGYKHYLEEGFSAGAGFQGIAVALLARNRPLWVVPSALFFGMLSYGGFVVNRIVPREMLDVLQAVILLLFILFDRMSTRSVSARPSKRKP